MNKFWQFFQNEQGKFSSIRLGFLIAIIPVMAIWTYLCLKQEKIIDIPMGVYSLIAILATSKVSQVWVNKRYHKEVKYKKPSSSTGFLSTFFLAIWTFIKKYIPFLRK